MTDELAPAARARLIVQALDPGANVVYLDGRPEDSRFLIRTRLNVGDGHLLYGRIGQWTASADEAWLAALVALQQVAEPEFVVVDPADGPRREWRWNGAAFAEIHRRVTR